VNQLTRERATPKKPNWRWSLATVFGIHAVADSAYVSRPMLVRVPDLNYDGSYGDGCYQIHSAWSGPVLADPPC